MQKKAEYCQINYLKVVVTNSKLLTTHQQALAKTSMTSQLIFINRYIFLGISSKTVQDYLKKLVSFTLILFLHAKLKVFRPITPKKFAKLIISFQLQYDFFNMNAYCLNISWK